MKAEAKEIVELVAKNHFWFEDRKKEPRDENDKKIYLEHVYVVVYRNTQTDGSGKEVVEVRFIPLKMNKKQTKMTDLISGEEIPISTKNGKITLSKIPEEIREIKTKYNSCEFMNFTRFFATFGDFCKSAFPKVDFAKIYNLSKLINCPPDVTVSDVVTLLRGAEKTYAKTEKDCAKKAKNVPLGRHNK